MSNSPLQCDSAAGDASGMVDLSRLFLNLDAEAREKFLQMGQRRASNCFNQPMCAVTNNLSFVNDADFRDNVHMYHWRQSLKKPFRIMDLPTELRVMIAEYALTSEERLCWEWLNHESKPASGSGMCRGTFAGLEQLTYLCRVSRQLYKETSTIVWKNNNFAFEENNLGIICDDKDNFGLTPRASLRHAHGFFLRVAGPAFTSRLRYITLGLYLGRTRGGSLLKGLHAASKLANLTAGATVSIHNSCWTQKDPKTSINNDLHDFITYRAIGNEHSAALLDLYPARKSRNWIVYPALAERGAFPDILGKSELAKALEWKTNGL
jgi:hypothetical protein